MLIPRVVPILLIAGSGLVKTVRFRDPKYVGDPINAVRIFNEKEVDELIILDVLATKAGHPPQFHRIEEIAGECFMPLCYGGGVRDLPTAEKILNLGVEKVAINTIAAEDPAVVSAIAAEFGSQSVVVSVDVKEHLFRGPKVHSAAGSKRLDHGPVEYARRMEELGAGELLLNSIDRDGTQGGFDLELVREVASAVSIPVIASGGASSLSDLLDAILAGASAVGAGSLFVFHGKHRAVLISYPERPTLEELFCEKQATIESANDA